MRLVAGTLAVICVLGCRKETLEDLTRSLAGVYRVESFTVNPQGCELEGPSALDRYQDRHLVVFGSQVMGQPALGLLSCRDPGACREKAGKLQAGAMLSGDFGYTFMTLQADGRLSASYAGTGFSSPDKKTCSGGSAGERTLVRSAGRLRIEERTRRARDYPADEEGLCRSDRAQAAAQGQPCGELSVLVAVKSE